MRITEQTKSGYFWLPSNPNNKVCGILKFFDGGKIELEMMDFFENETIFITDFSLPKIIGIIEKDQWVILEQCYYKVRKSGVIKSLIHVNYALVDNNTFSMPFDDINSDKINVIRFAVDGLDEWFSENISDERYSTWRSQPHHTVNYIPPNEVFYHLKNEMEIKIIFHFNMKIGDLKPKITKQTYIELISQKTQSLNEFSAIIRKLTHFFCFAINQIVSIKDVSIIHNSKLISLYYQSNPYTREIPDVEYRMLLFNDQLANSFLGNYFDRWLEIYEKFEASMDLYFGYKTGAHKYIESNFLFLAQALEVYHRKVSNETLKEKNEFQELKQRIVNLAWQICSKEEIEWLSDKLRFGNELSFRKRLKEIIQPFCKHIANNSKKCKSIINTIVDTRNYLTHYDNNKNSDSNIAQGNEFAFYCLKMEALLQVTFLKELGFSIEQIDNIVENEANQINSIKTIKNKLKI
jgi:hypothetical protein